MARPRVDMVLVSDGVRREEFDYLAPTASRLGLQLLPLEGPPEAALAATAVVTKTVPIGGQLLGSLPSLRVIHKLGMLVDNIDLEVARARGITVLTAPLPSAVAVAEHAFCLMLASARHLVRAHQAVTSRENPAGLEPKRTSELEYVYDWAGLPPSLLLYGKTLGIVGMGEIGLEVVRRARGFGMRVLYYKRKRLLPALEAELGISYCRLEELLPHADLLTLHLPHTAETEALLDERKIGLMKQGAILVNTARGGLVDEEALCQALASGRLAGAGLDVFRYEPLPAESPLQRMDNVVLTPHIAGAGIVLYREYLQHVLNGVRKALDAVDA